MTRGKGLSSRGSCSCRACGRATGRGTPPRCWSGGGVEHRAVRIALGPQLPADHRKGVFPTDRLVAIAGLVVAHRLRQPALRFEPVVGLLAELGNRVLARRNPHRPDFLSLPRQRPSRRSRRTQMRTGHPAPARHIPAIEPIGLVDTQQRARDLKAAFLLRGVLDGGLDRAPAAGRFRRAVSTRRLRWVVVCISHRYTTAVSIVL